MCLRPWFVCLVLQLAAAVPAVAQPAFSPADDGHLVPVPENDGSEEAYFRGAPVPAGLATASTSGTEAVDEGGECACDAEHVCCTCEKAKALKAAAAAAHKDLFYQNDFQYLCDPCYDDWQLGDRLKRIPVGSCWMVDVGGQYRLRFHSEQNINNTGAVPNTLGLTGDDDDYLLQRTRVYVNAERGEHLRFYGELLDASSEFNAGVPRVIEENRHEIQNLFVDLRGWDTGRGLLGARVGRQEIALGVERLVSPLDWANTRRTFDGVRMMWQGDCWDLDGIWLRPLRRDAAHVDSVDPPNLDRQMYGVYGTYKGLTRDKLETYWLALNYEDVGPGGFHYHTLGARYYGSQEDWLYEFEGGYQLGRNADDTDHAAGFCTAGLGRKFSQRKFTPTLWLYYDWASGDDTVGNGFHHYEPLSHRYLGFMDLFARSNIEDVNAQLTMTLTEKVKFLFWYHYLRLANGNDVPYNVNMTPFAGLGAGTSGSRELGHEVDFVLTHTLTPRSAILYGYSHFFAGDYYDRSPVPTNLDGDFLYLQWHVNF